MTVKLIHFNLLDQARFSTFCGSLASSYYYFGVSQTLYYLLFPKSPPHYLDIRNLLSMEFSDYYFLWNSFFVFEALIEFASFGVHQYCRSFEVHLVKRTYFSLFFLFADLPNLFLLLYFGFWTSKFCLVDLFLPLFSSSILLIEDFRCLLSSSTRFGGESSDAFPLKFYKFRELRYLNL